MFTTPLLEEKLRVQAELSARCQTMAQYLVHNEATARSLATQHGFKLRYRVPDGFHPPALNRAVLEPAPDTALALNDKEWTGPTSK